MEQLKKRIESQFRDKIKFGITFLVYLLLDLYLIRLLQRLIDSASAMDTSTFFSNIKLFLMMLLMTIVFIIFEQYYLRKIKNYGNINLTKSAFTSLFRKKFSNDERHKAGKIVSQINSDVPIISNWLSSGTTTMFIQLIILTACMVMIFIYSFEIALFVVVITGLTYGFAKYISIKTAQNMMQMQELKEKISEKSYEGLQNVSVIKQLQKESYFSDAIKELSTIDYKHVVDKLSRFKALENSELNFLADILPLCTLVIGVFLTTYGRLTIGSALAVMLITQKLNEPIIVLADLLISKKTAQEVYNRIEDLFKITDDESFDGNVGVPRFERLDIKVNTYQYLHATAPVLNNIILALERGDILLLKGESGKGKTTLINMISRFISFDGLDGSVLYNGYDVSKYKLHDYYQHVLQVEQKTLLIEGTLEENLLLGDGYSAELIEEVTYACCLDDFIKVRGFNFKIEENGKNISGGEQQRIGLARMLLRKPELLILDEVTSALNIEIRNEIADRIVKFKEAYDMTLIVISHDNAFEKYISKVYKV